MLLNLRRTAHRILDRELYSFLREEICDALGTDQPTEEQVAEFLDRNPAFLEEYRRLNRENDISNVDLVELPVSQDEAPECRRLKRELNQLRQRLLSLEKFEGPPSWLLYAIWTGFVVALLQFFAHNVFAIYTNLYATAPALVFGTYGLLTLVGILVVLWKVRRHWRLRDEFHEVLGRFENLAQEAISQGCLQRDDLYGSGNRAGRVH